MPTTAKYGFPTPVDADPADIPVDSKELADAIDAVIVGIATGTLAGRPAAGKLGRHYYATDNGKIYFDTGAAWLEEVIGTDARLSDQRTPLDNSVTQAKMADDSVGSAEIITDSVGSSELAPQAVTAAEINNALKPSAGAAAGTESLRALGSTASTAAAGNDARLSDQRVPTDNSVSTAKIQDDAVTEAKIADAIIQRLFDVGDLRPVAYAMSAGSEPTGWLYCDGRAVSRTGANAALFAKIGTAYGSGDGSTTFNLPDFRGRALVAPDDAAGRLSALDARGQAGGEQTHLLTAAESGLPEHDHNVQYQQLGGSGYQAEQINAASVLGGNKTMWRVDTAGGSDGSIEAGPYFGGQSAFSVGYGVGGVPGGARNAAQAHNVMQPYAVAGGWLVKL